MIKVMYGQKGTGKTKFLVSTANNLVAEKTGDIVFIDYSNQLMYDLKHEIRFINVKDFPGFNSSAFMGFICGIISEDYDINNILIDGITYIVSNHEDASWKEFFNNLKQISEKFNVDFYISMSGDENNVPDYIKELE